MNQTSTSQPQSDSVPAVIADKLAHLRHALRRWLIAAGLARLLGVVVAMLALSLLLDWLFRMDLAQRLFALVVMATVTGYVLVRFLLAPLRTELDDDALIARVEAKHPDVGQQISDALQFARLRDVERFGVSPAMVRQAIRDGAAAAERVDFGDVLKHDLRRRNVIVASAAAGVLLLGAVGVLATDTLSIWFNRNVLLGEAQWPQDTNLVIQGVENGRLRVPRGDDWQPIVEAKGVVPPVVYIDYEPMDAPGFGWGGGVTEQMTRLGEDRFQTTLRNVLEPFRFRVRGGDDRGTWITARLVDRPGVAELELYLTPPDYAGDQPELLPAGKSPYYALKGSSLRIVATTNKPVNEATLQFAGKTAESAPMKVTTVTPPTEREPQYSVLEALVPAEALADGAYGIDLIGADGLASKRPTRFAIKLRPDREPLVKAALTGIGTMVVPQARVPVGMTLSDDYAVTAARLVYQVRQETPEPTGDSPIPQEKPFNALTEKYGVDRIEYEYPFDLTALNLPVGASLGFHVEATDNDTVSGPKTGTSSTFYVKVVTPQELREDLLRREQEQRQAFERLLKDQESMLIETRGILADVRGKDSPDDVRAKLSKLEKQQALAADRCLSIARQFDQIKAEYYNNRLEEPDGPIETRLQRRIIDPMRGVAEQAVPPAARLLEAARKNSRQPTARDKALVEAAAQQQRIVTAMREVLRHMAKWEGYQEALNLAYEVLKAQEQVNDETVKAMEERIRSIFGED